MKFLFFEKARGPDEDDVWDAKMGEALALGLLGRHAESVASLDVVLPELVKRKLPAWNLAQAKLGLAGSLKALGKDPALEASLLCCRCVPLLFAMEASLLL